ncbi:NAD(P)-dependent oxidoreductase [Paenibacillus piri]|uniref:Hydroxyacid dehydrogenase n=1 Tax=Paenibacillus piri TaxID=2547395 RepID=A0A4R5KSY1_9BACL|nr:NAD(P)-dependent oxidoreductase [Paenibacillus piri]TDF97967.1 hydroxyacid dehydrogenase [Paenibacillus piri]
MNILVTAPYTEATLKGLDPIGNIHFRPWKPHGRAYYAKELIQLLQETGADALITEHDHVDAEVMNAAKLSFIGVCRGTPSNVDIAEATRLGIPVFNTPARNAQAVAEMVAAGIIVFLRKMRESELWLKEGSWKADAHESYLNFRGHELCGRTVGIVGFGGVGRKVAHLLKQFSCNIQFFDPYLTEDPDPEYKRCTAEQLFSTSDVVSIHLPATQETEKIISHELLGLMKSDAILVNSARASVVDRDALYSVLKESRIAGAVLDVFWHEPPQASDYELIRLPNVYATPHIAGASYEVDHYGAVIMNEAVHEFFIRNNHSIRQLVNPSILSDKHFSS